MILLRPEFLWLLLLWLPTSVWWFRHQRTSGWHQVIDPSLISALTPSKTSARIVTRWWLPCLLLLVILALSGPGFSNSQQKTASQGNLYVILDNSLSMAATDISPDRLTRAKRMIIDWAKSGLFDKTSVITYSASAHTLTPLTSDAQTIELQLQSLTPYIMPEFGNRPELAFAQLQKTLTTNNEPKPHILWLTDDIPDSKVDALKNVLPDVKSASLVALGTAAGSPIPLPNNQGYLMNGNEMVIVKTDSSQILANGQKLGFSPVSLGAQPNPDRFNRLDAQDSTQTGNKDVGYWLLFPVIVLWLMFGRQRSMSLVAVLVMSFGFTTKPAYAFDLFKNSEQQAYEALQRKDSEAALSLTDRADIRGQALFDSQQYEAAAEAFAQQQEADNFYNLGNALAHAGKLREAIKAYDQAIALADIPQAQTNKAKIEEYLNSQNQNSSQQQSGDQNDNTENGQQSSDQNAEAQSGQTSQQNPQDSSSSPQDAALEADAQDTEQQNGSPQDKQTSQEAEQQTPATEPADEQAGQPQQGLDPQQMRAEQEAEAVLNQLQSNRNSLLQQKFRFQYQQNPTESDGTLW